MKIAIKTSLIIGLCAMYSCSSDDSTSDADKLNKLVSNDTSVVYVSNELFDKMIGSVPSPIELNSVIKESGAEYSASLLNPTSISEKYTDDSYKAMNLGVYGLDLGYMTSYNKSHSSGDYISSISKQAGDLNVGQFFDFNLLQKLISTTTSEDLMTESNNSFRKMNSFLIEQRRGEISVLIILGSWIEGIYLTSQIAVQTKNQELIYRVGEQKKAVDNMLILLKIFKDNPKFTDFIKELEELQVLYKGVTISFVYAEPTKVVVDGEIEIIDNSKEEIIITNEQFQNISEKIKQIRNKLTKNN